MALQLTAIPARIAMYSAMLEIFSSPALQDAACSVYRAWPMQPEGQGHQDQHEQVLDDHRRHSPTRRSPPPEPTAARRRC